MQQRVGGTLVLECPLCQLFFDMTFEQPIGWLPIESNGTNRGGGCQQIDNLIWSFLKNMAVETPLALTTLADVP